MRKKNVLKLAIVVAGLILTVACKCSTCAQILESYETLCKEIYGGDSKVAGFRCNTGFLSDCGTVVQNGVCTNPAGPTMPIPLDPS